MEYKDKTTMMKRVNTEQLFGESKEILIEHMGESYMLTITKHKKLLLTKNKQHTPALSELIIA